MESIRSTGAEPLSQCFTQHEAFQGNTSVWTLHSEYKHYKRRHLTPGTQEELYRYTAYRHLVFWIWGKLAKDNRRPLPACVMKAVREKYPSESGADKGFQLPKLSK